MYHTYQYIKIKAGYTIKANKNFLKKKLIPFRKFPSKDFKNTCIHTDTHKYTYAYKIFTDVKRY